MDKDTRNAIERATQRARQLLEDDFVSQLEGIYDVLRTGEVAATGGPHLSPRKGAVREKIVAAVEHKRAAGAKPGEAVAGYARDAAFTALNRFVALKMLEARGLLQECVTKGELSSGYKEFCGLAPGVALLPEWAGYRLYVECLFDELSTEIKVLFDRRDPASALWPKRATFEELLAVFNAPDLAGVWGEDETIGWVYQFFNSGDERRTMREESQAPRNSRELAVRNQFFTPRYVVRFLTENTLGRTWIEMMGEQTRLAEKCDFLVTGVESRRPRAKKDPRDIRILDPACGSGHFLLYAFDLLLAIYEEAWADADAAPRVETGRKLRQDYPDLDSLHRAVPGLILGENLYGVDIDPRCVQIAALALWLRAQRAHREFGVPSNVRPSITRTHIVVAEPMPGDTALVESFAADLQPPLLGDLFRKMVAEMRLAGELGSLIRVDKGIREELERARQQWNRDREPGDLLPGLDEYRIQAALDLSSIDDARFFGDAEAKLLAALRRFAESAAGAAGVRRRLFAGDAAQGIALIDLLRTDFDVVLMNPPFGVGPLQTAEILEREYPTAYTELYACFVARAVQLCREGVVGCLSSRGFLTMMRLTEWRKQTLIPRLALLLDLGIGVMDAAFVRACAYVLRNGAPRCYFLDLQGVSNPEELLSARCTLTQAEAAGWTARSRDLFASLPEHRLMYRETETLAKLFSTLPSLGSGGVDVRAGLQTFDDSRFVRAIWEVPPLDVGRGRRWEWFSKGGEFTEYVGDIHLVIQREHGGAELAALNERKNGQTAQVRRSSECYYRAGAFFTSRSGKGLSVRALPAECVFSHNAPALIPSAGAPSMEYVLGWVNTPFIRSLARMLASADYFTAGAIKSLPFALPDEATRSLVEASARLLLTLFSEVGRRDETNPVFSGLEISRDRSLGQNRQLADDRRRDLEKEAELIQQRISSAIDVLYEMDEVTRRAFTEELESLVVEDEQAKEPRGVSENEDSGVADVARSRDFLLDLVSWTLGVAFGRLDVRLATGERAAPPEPDPFDPLPACSPGMLTGDDGLPLSGAPVGYPLALPADGLLADDPGNPRDLTSAVRSVFEVVFGPQGDARWNEAAELLDPKGHDLRAWISGSFFEHHLKRYTKSRRKAPILWQLATPSGRYSVWLYAQRATSDTLFHIQNEILVPKLVHEERRLAALVSDGGPNLSSAARKEIDQLDSFVGELRALRDEVARVAPLWKPDLNDGVLLTMAPLWRLVPQHRPWQKELKTAWGAMCRGEYDWAHLSMHLWPERVVPKCAADRSLAIAHGLEDVFWVQGSDGKWTARAKPTRPLDELTSERSSAAVKAALQGLNELPAAQGTARLRRAKGTR